MGCKRHAEDAFYEYISRCTLQESGAIVAQPYPSLCDMFVLARALAVTFALALPGVGARADGPEASLGGFLCARPFAPDCAAQPTTYRSPLSIASCQIDVEHFIAASIAYRDCLQRQIAGAMRNANDVLDRFRCESQPAKPCAVFTGR